MRMNVRAATRQSTVERFHTSCRMRPLQDRETKGKLESLAEGQRPEVGQPAGNELAHYCSGE